MQLLNSPWSPARRLPAAQAPAVDDEDLVLGWECAVPALQVEEWEPAATAAVEGTAREAG